MAYDKVVDSSVLDAGLKAIADAIREKGGTGDNLAIPQAMADAIAAIEAGGGLPMPYVTGTFSFAEDTTKAALDVKEFVQNRNTPRFAIVYRLNGWSTWYPELKFGAGLFSSKTGAKSVYYGLTDNNYRKPMYDITSGIIIDNILASNTYRCLIFNLDSETPFKAGDVYRWFLFGGE